MGSSTLKAQVKMLDKIRSKGLRTPTILHSSKSRLVIEDVGETAEEVLTKHPELRLKYLEYERQVVKASGMPKFLTDISPRNIGYKNGEFIVFDPARIDPYTVYVGSGVFAGLFSAGVASKLDEFIDGIIAGEAE